MAAEKSARASQSPLSSLRTQGPIPRDIRTWKESRPALGATNSSLWLWIPACAGTTWKERGRMVRDGALRLLTMRVSRLAASEDLILRSPPQAGVSKDGPHIAPAPHA